MRDAASFLDFILNSRLSCGTKCTEHKDQCWSYAWNGATKQCKLFSNRCSIDSITDQHQNNWVHYTLQVLFDIAINKTAKQSSTYAQFVAYGAVDGNRGTDQTKDMCAHTDVEDTNPWWMVDLLAVYYITAVRILNRGMDENEIGLTESDVNTPCGFFAGPGSLSQLVVIDCPKSTLGRCVNISKTTAILNICEIDVFGVKV
nr:fucolectin-like [Crassostrea gigas]